jgi:hypothetical protein
MTDTTLHPIGEQELQVIDLLTNEGKPTFSSAVHQEVDLFDEALRAQGFTAYAALEEYKYRSPYRRSLWCRRESDGRCAPELFLLATLRYGLLPLILEPKWLDGNPVHNKIENVMLVQIPGAREEGDGRTKRNKYGVPAGTVEYRKRYYNDPVNREKRKQAARKSAAKSRQVLRSAKDSLPPEEVEALAKQILFPRITDIDDKLAQLLSDPDVMKKILSQAELLHTVGGVEMEEALKQARDAVLGLPNRVALPEEVENEISEENA